MDGSSFSVINYIAISSPVISFVLCIFGTSQVAQWVKNPTAMQETQIQSLNQEGSLKKDRETHSSIFAWETPWTEKPGRYKYIGSQRVGHHQSD